MLCMIAWLTGRGGVGPDTLLCAPGYRLPHQHIARVAHTLDSGASIVGRRWDQPPISRRGRRGADDS